MKPLLALALLAAAALAGCAVPAGTHTGTGNPHVLIHTSLGDMTAEIYSDKAPITAKNFLTYVTDGFYKDRQFYRIVPGFVSQGGGEKQGNTGNHPPIADEAQASGLHNLKYTLAMARTSDPASATTEFFINAADNTAGNTNNLDPGGVSPDGYAVFGIVTGGRDVADALNAHTGATPTFTISVTGDSTAAPATATATTAPLPPCPSVADTGASPRGPVELDLITPGVWNVCSATETNFLWVHNNSTAGKDYAWSITGPNGTALPAGWTVTFATPSGTLSVAGTKAGTGSRSTYPDWAATRVTLKLPANYGTGTVPAELHAAGATRAFAFRLNDPQPVSGPGTKAGVHYDGRFESDNTRFDTGDFSTTLGSGQTVPGFDNGLMGLAPGETAALHIPPAFAYGYDNPAGNYQKFNGRTLLFIVTMTKIN
ncbi:MAG: peptidyl-prolyl cis-trans isomerase [Thermoplasmata archaeon]|jgi:cyclophilin family peptidyl-prolyl cis-trans isomerase|nr:peptidyl-prolyl cis-trans isomerase [Thermoplasmata archaeon]